MAEFAKAQLVEITADATPKVKGDPIPVQFNPSTMRLQMTNAVEGGKTRGRQVQQFNGNSSTTLTLDLVFDSADEGDDKPRNVRERSLQVARFVLPSAQSKEAPPRVRFHWGDFVFNGVMNSMTEDIDLFSSEGIPLRSKVSIAIKEQDSKFEALQSGAGAKDGGGAQAPGGDAGGSNAGLGANGGGHTDRTAEALHGESAADFAARMGLDPGAWRGLTAGIQNPLSLQGGLQIDFNSSLSLDAGVGLSAQLDVGGSLGLAASVGLDVSGGTSAGGDARAGFALSAAGGVTAAAQAVDVVRTESAAAQARAAFEAPSSGVAATGQTTKPATLGAGSLSASVASGVTARGSAAIDTSAAAPVPNRTPFQRAASSLRLAPAGAAPAPPPPRSDPRAVSFGFGVPLRPRISGAADDRLGAEGWVTVGVRPRQPNAPETRDPTASPWLALPAASADRAAGDAGQQAGAATASCACGRCAPVSQGCACGRGGAWPSM
jgi:contractile injection system tube protein